MPNNRNNILVDPRGEYYHDAYPAQQQEPPGLESRMQPCPDTGEELSRTRAAAGAQGAHHGRRLESAVPSPSLSPAKGRHRRQLICRPNSPMPLRSARCSTAREAA